MSALPDDAPRPAAWSPQADAVIRANYGRLPSRRIGQALGRTVHQIVGRARALGLVRPVVWEARELALLRRHYRGGDSAAISALVETTGKTCDQVKKKARALGLAGRKPPDWTPEDAARLTELWGRAPDATVATRLGRTVSACKMKAKRLGRARQDGSYGWNLAELGRLLGVDRKVCARWVGKGWLTATAAPYRLNGNGLRIVGEPSLLRFLKERPHEYRWERMGDPSGYYRRIAKEASVGLLTVADVAARYGVATNTASRWMQNGWVAAVRGHGTGGKGAWYVRAADLEGWQSPRPELVGRRGRGKAATS